MLPPTRLIVPLLSFLLAISLYIQYIRLPSWGNLVAEKPTDITYFDSFLSSTQRQHTNEVIAVHNNKVVKIKSTNTNVRTNCQRLPDGGLLHIVWAWHDPPIWQAMNQTLSALPPQLQVQVYCGSSACAAAAQRIIVQSTSTSSHECWSVQLLVAPTLAQDTPLEEWIGEHVLAKLLSGPYYEETLQVALQLAVLYKYGGGVMLLNGSSRTSQGLVEQLLHHIMDDDQTDSNMILLTDAAGGWVRHGIGGGVHAAASRGSKNSVYEAMMHEMLILYQWPNYVKSHWPVQISWDNLCARVEGCANAKRHWKNIPTVDIIKPVVSTDTRHYGTLSYQARWYHTKHVLKASDMNKGDEMQGLGGLQFLPRLDAFVERDRLDVVDVISSSTNFTPTSLVSPNTKPRPAAIPTTVFFNAWWASPTWVWPPPGELDPILVSMHLHWDSTKQDVNRSIDYLNDRWPVGARDTETHAFLQSIGVHSIFTACMTMTLLPSWSTGRAARERTDEILVVDVTSNKAMQSLPRHVRMRAKKLTARMFDKNIVGDRVARYVEAHKMKIRLQKAKLVITQRLHIALPAASMGTPVILIMDEDMPGGGGAAGLTRFSGLQAAVHCFQTTGAGPAALAAFDWNSPPPNPNPELLQKKRNVLRVLAMCHGGVADSARKFGVIPPSWEYPLEKETCEDGITTLDSNVIRIATAIDSVWLDRDPVLSSWIHALFESNPKERFAFYFLTNEMNEKQRCLVRWMVLRWFPTAEVYTIPMDDALKNLPYSAAQYIPTVAKTRVLLPRLLPCIERIIWVDLDTIVLKPLRNVWTDRETMSSCGIVARSLLDNESLVTLIRRVYNKTSPMELWKKSSNNNPGFDAGVMLLDLAILRESRFVETVAEYWSMQLGGSDQVSMNMQCNGTHGKLDPVWNVLVDSPKDHVYERFEDWSIVHFNGAEKPWQTERPSKQYRVWENHSLSLIDALYRPPSL